MLWPGPTFTVIGVSGSAPHRASLPGCEGEGDGPGMRTWERRPFPRCRLWAGTCRDCPTRCSWQCRCSVGVALRSSSHTWRFNLREPLGWLGKSSADPNGNAVDSSTKSLLHARQVRPEQSDPPELKGRWLGVWAWRPRKRPLSCLGPLHLGGDEDLGPSPPLPFLGRNGCGL